MSHLTLNQLVESRLSSQWGVTTPIKYENMDFVPPVGASWISCAVKESDSRKITLGSGAQVRRTIGNVFVEIVTPNGIGANTARGYADQIKTIFRDYRVSGLHVQGDGDVFIRGEPYYPNSGSNVTATDQQYHVYVSMPFRYDVLL